MNSERLEKYRTRFLQGDLSCAEEAEFKRMLAASDREDDAALNHYFNSVANAESADFNPMSKEAFFQYVSERSQKRRRWYASAAAIGAIAVVCGGFLGVHFQKSGNAREDVDRSLETTRRALTGISTRINSSISDASRAMDYSRPLEIFSKMNSQLKTAEDADINDVK